jgi:hypothetical protein
MVAAIVDFGRHLEFANKFFHIFFQQKYCKARILKLGMAIREEFKNFEKLKKEVNNDGSMTLPGRHLLGRHLSG